MNGHRFLLTLCRGCGRSDQHFADAVTAYKDKGCPDCSGHRFDVVPHEDANRRHKKARTEALAGGARPA